MNLSREEIENMPAGREMDALIATRIIGWKIDDLTAISPTGSRNARIPHGDWWLEYYSTNIAAAWEVVEWMRENGFSFMLIEHADPNGDYIIEFWRRDNLDEPQRLSCRFEEAPLAICRAALLATLEK